ncbi:ABC transporter ATP-binding protein [Frigidibacter mobilis]|uniref:ABC alpha-glucoside transporter, ATPase subunit AglK n=1 Tax=Frigidibacter mobilis TaxID=1335048 RepID=A0A159Z122_9RHOB|nr:sn-glycerol-3-phosphate ABC transporter ATP-binding protein UgpC [Frigidibacter mobilis]AMY68547.1 ABC alpha-glucoside transporter, ATPase subunit AglK [Frigidibacter mobilis]
MAGVELHGVGKSYGEVQVINGIDLDITAGEFVVFVGPSGCGKSTLLRMIAGLERITAGTLSIDGQVVNDVPPAQRGIAMVFQSYALYPHMTVRENMEFALKIARKSRDEIAAAVENAARILQLTPYLDRLPKALSGGQRQRVAIGRAIVRDPKVFLFDEPLSNLDAALRVATRIEIAQLKERLPGRTMIYVTHDQIEAMTLADRIVVLNAGGIAQVGSPLELYERPDNEFVAQFIGSPAMNLLPATLVGTGATSRVQLPGGAEVTVPIATAAALQGQAVKLGVRPEHLDLAGPGTPALIEAPVEVAEKLGDVTVVYVTMPGEAEAVIAKLPGTAPVARGEVLRLTADPARMHLFHQGKSLRRG